MLFFYFFLELLVWEKIKVVIRNGVVVVLVGVGFIVIGVGVGFLVVML